MHHEHDNLYNNTSLIPSLPNLQIKICENGPARWWTGRGWGRWPKRRTWRTGSRWTWLRWGLVLQSTGGRWSLGLGRFLTWSRCIWTGCLTAIGHHDRWRQTGFFAEPFLSELCGSFEPSPRTSHSEPVRNKAEIWNFENFTKVILILLDWRHLQNTEHFISLFIKSWLTFWELLRWRAIHYCNDLTFCLANWCWPQLPQITYRHFWALSGSCPPSPRIQ